MVKINLHNHAESRMVERGAKREEIIETVKYGERFPAKYGRTGFRRNFSFEAIGRANSILQSKSKLSALKRMVG